MTEKSPASSAHTEVQTLGVSEGAESVQPATEQAEEAEQGAVGLSLPRGGDSGPEGEDGVNRPPLAKSQSMVTKNFLVKLNYF